MSRDHHSDTADKSLPARQTSTGEEDVDALALDHLAQFLYRDPDSFPKRRRRLRSAGPPLAGCASRTAGSVRPVAMASRSPQVHRPELAADIREGLAPAAVLTRRLGLGDTECAVVDLVESWIA
jgi:hypothetical protein